MRDISCGDRLCRLDVIINGPLWTVGILSHLILRRAVSWRRISCVSAYADAKIVSLAACVIGGTFIPSVQEHLIDVVTSTFWFGGQPCDVVEDTVEPDFDYDLLTVAAIDPQHGIENAHERDVGPTANSSHFSTNEPALESGTHMALRYQRYTLR